MTVFYPGLHQPGDARHFERCCISINRLRRRKKPVSGSVLVDSGAFTEILRHGGYRTTVEAYARELSRLAPIMTIAAAVAQDYMCEPFMLGKTGLTVQDHQRLTVERYDGLTACSPPCPVMPVLQGYQPSDYVRHVEAYGHRLTPGMWVGVGSICKRNSNPRAILDVLSAIHARRPDLKLHGFGVKRTTLAHPQVREMLATADSLAWSFAARREGRNQNDWREADRFARQIATARELPQMAMRFQFRADSVEC